MSKFDATAEFEKFIEEADGDELKEAASKMLHHMGTSNLFLNQHGSVGHVIRQRLLAQHPMEKMAILEMVPKILEHFKIPLDYVPPIPVVGDALALIVKLRQVLEPLTKNPAIIAPSYPVRESKTLDRLVHRLLEVSKDFETPEAVHLLEYEELHKLFNQVLR